MDDRDLSQTLVSRAHGYRERVPVHRIAHVPQASALKRAALLADLVWDFAGDCAPRLDVVSSEMARLVLPEDGRVNVYPESGAIDAFITSSNTREPLAEDERKAEREKIRARLREVAESIGRHFLRPDEELRPERLWEKKGQGQALSGPKSPVTLFEVVGSLRRYVHGLPVLGRASVHVGIGGGHRIIKWGVDWREREEGIIAETPVIDPAEGAKRIVAELAVRQPGRATERVEPERMTLGYVSMPRRQRQSVLQPAWVATFAPRGAGTMGTIVVVPAAPAAFEPLTMARRR